MSVRRLTAAFAAASISLSLAFGGVASAGSSEKPVSKKVFIATADEICESGNEELDEAASIVFGANQPGTDPVPAQVDDYVLNYVIPIVSANLESIESIKVKKKSLRTKIAKLVANARIELDELASDPQLALTAENVTPGTARLAKALGLKVCAQ